MKNSIILASNSPRRKELLAQVGICFEAEAADIEEVIRTDLPIGEAIEQSAYAKAACVAKRHPEDVVIGADTIVYLDGEVLGKPHTAKSAKEMLWRLSGKQHQVITGVAILSSKKEECFHIVSDVTFFELSEEEIDAYIQTKEPLDKAGAYGIQGKGAIFVAKIVGDYYNIVGLPIAEVAHRLKAHTID